MNRKNIQMRRQWFLSLTTRKKSKTVGYRHRSVGGLQEVPPSDILQQLSGHLMYSVISSYLLGGGGNSPPPESQIPPQKNTQNTKNIKKCIEFTPQICVFPPEPGV